ncbi:hypothetical protein VNO80_28701 [Phaseolus coccineus]|uniref:Uncharacterized protein n=1 Tax=Phaseolus coccineus TaxID=3886 RepID=A0AAN9QEB6_PHACN
MLRMTALHIHWTRSLLVAGLVSSIQNHQPKPPSSPNRVEHYLIIPADKLISNGQLRPQALAIQTNQILITNPPSSSSSLQATHSSSKMSGGKTGSNMKCNEHNKARKHIHKKRPEIRTLFGQKMKSLLSPCQQCWTVEQGAVKAQTIPRENLKIY